MTGTEVWIAIIGEEHGPAVQAALTVLAHVPPGVINDAIRRIDRETAIGPMTNPAAHLDVLKKTGDRVAVLRSKTGGGQGVKAISLKQPWASAVVFGAVGVINATRRVPVRPGLVLIHAARRADDDALRDEQVMSRLSAGHGLAYSDRRDQPEVLWELERLVLARADPRDVHPVTPDGWAGD